MSFKCYAGPLSGSSWEKALQPLLPNHPTTRSLPVSRPGNRAQWAIAHERKKQVHLQPGARGQRAELYYRHQH